MRNKLKSTLAATAVLAVFLLIPFAEMQSAEQPNVSVQSTGKLSGRIVDSKGEPLAGAAIMLKNSTRGVLTDNDGYFTIDGLKQGTVLIVNNLGYQDVEYTYTGKDNITIVMQDQSNYLDDVVIVAFGEQKKESLISSITTVKADELKVSSSNLTSGFAGKLPGVISYQTTGEPGADNAQFFVRGVTTFGYNSSPLILVDGFESTSTDLARLQPDDIESFSILKDASAAALYGSRGANGVILVNTKIGREGKAKVNIRFDENMAAPTRMNELVDGVTYMNLYNEAVYTRRGLTGPREDFYSNEKILGTMEGKYPMIYPDIDWYDELFKRQTFNTKVNINVSGGGNVAQYYVAGGYDHETGLLKVDNLNNFNNNISINRFHIRSNVLFKLTKTTKLDVRISGRFERYNGPYDSATSVFNSVMNANPVDYPAVWQPDASHQYANHILFGYAEGAPANPYAKMVRGYESRDETTINAQATLAQDFDPWVKGLKLQFKASANVYSYYSAKRKYSPFYYGLLDANPDTGTYSIYCTNPGNPDALLGNVEPGRNGSAKYYFELRLNWARSFGRHNVGAMLVGTAQENVLTSGNSTNIFETLPERNVCQSGRLSYDFDSRYFVEFNYGYNGSEKFAPKYRWGFFPSAGLGWMISNEPYYPAGLKKVMPTLKLRGTYGQVGNDAIASRADRFFYLSEVVLNNTGEWWGMNYTNNYYADYTIKRYANPDIQWEISTKLNAGIEIGFFKDEAVKITADYFKEDRRNIYMPYATYPMSAGFGSSASIAGNIGEVESEGCEVAVDIKHYFNNKVWLTGRANFTYSTNKYLKLSEIDYREPWRSKVGHNINQQWGYIAERLFVDEAEIANSPTQTFGAYQPGDIKYKDVNGDGVIDSSDMVPIGHPSVPEMQYGFGLSLGVHNVDFSFFFQGNARVSFFIQPTKIAPFENRRNALKIVADDYYSESNPNVHAFWPRLSTTTLANNTQMSTWWLRNGSFMRLKSLEIGYTFPKFKAIGMESARIYFTGENLFIISPFKMWDPEMGGNGLGYPINRRFNIGFQLNF